MFAVCSRRKGIHQSIGSFGSFGSCGWTLLSINRQRTQNKVFDRLRCLGFRLQGSICTSFGKSSAECIGKMVPSPSPPHSWPDMWGIYWTWASPALFGVISGWHATRGFTDKAHSVVHSVAYTYAFAFATAGWCRRLTVWCTERRRGTALCGVLRACKGSQNSNFRRLQSTGRPTRNGKERQKQSVLCIWAAEAGCGGWTAGRYCVVNSSFHSR